MPCNALPAPVIFTSGLSLVTTTCEVDPRLKNELRGLDLLVDMALITASSESSSTLISTVVSEPLMSVSGAFVLSV